jgi:hypothetical protein
MKWLVLPQLGGKRLLLRVEYIQQVREIDEGCEIVYRRKGEGLMFHKIGAPFDTVVSVIEEASKAVDQGSSHTPQT